MSARRVVYWTAIAAVVGVAAVSCGDEPTAPARVSPGEVDTIDASSDAPPTPPKCGLELPVPAFLGVAPGSRGYHVARAGRLFFNDFSTHEIRSIARDGTDPRVHLRGADSRVPFVLDDEWLYIPDLRTRTIAKVSLTGAPSEALGPFEWSFRILGLEASFVFLVPLDVSPPAYVQRVPKTGGSPVMVAASSNASGGDTIAHGVLYVAEAHVIHGFDLAAPSFPEKVSIALSCDLIVAADSLYCRTRHGTVERYSLDGRALGTIGPMEGDRWIAPLLPEGESVLIGRTRTRSGERQIDYVAANGASPRPIGCIAFDATVARDGPDVYVHALPLGFGEHVYWRFQAE